MFSLPARSGGSRSVISSYLAHIFFSSFCSLRSCIAVSSSLAVGASRVPHQYCGQAHFSQVASSAKKKTKKQKPGDL